MNSPQWIASCSWWNDSFCHPCNVWWNGEGRNALYLILKRVFFTHVVSQTFHKPKDVVCYFISAYISKSPDKTSCTGACSFVSKNSVYFWFVFHHLKANSCRNWVLTEILLPFRLMFYCTLFAKVEPHVFFCCAFTRLFSLFSYTLFCTKVQIFYKINKMLERKWQKI